MRATWAAVNFFSQFRQVEITCLLSSIFGGEELVRQIAMCERVLMQWCMHIFLSFSLQLGNSGSGTGKEHF